MQRLNALRKGRSRQALERAASTIEWPTVGLLLACHAAWLAGLFAWSLVSWGGAPFLAAPILALTITLHSSLQHEALHGHPTRWRRVNELLVSLPIGLLVPYRRFEALHLAHHRSPDLTDPYDDPESFYLPPSLWRGLRAPLRALMTANNTLAGRMLLGPAITLARFFGREAAALRDGDARVAKAWALHLLGVVPVLTAVLAAGVPLLAYLALAYAGASVLMLRTFLEHQAHEMSRCRSVIIERGGFLGFLFLNNHLHAVHHAHPGTPWYALPALYRRQAARFRAMNGGYVYRSYGEILRAYAFRAKESVPHPLMEA